MPDPQTGSSTADLVTKLRTKRRHSGCSQDEIFDLKYKAAVKAYQNYMEGFQLMLSENERKINQILESRSVPLWFQELSDEQVETMNLLLGAIRDDMDEDTVFRCRSLIFKLGVYPLCPDSIFREARIMSHGNDLSFLWFLLELFYSKKRHGSVSSDYANNERLLMSSICHLDMSTTLRGLEDVLPPAVMKTKPFPSSCSKSSFAEWPCHGRYCSPYLEPQRVPKPRSKQLPAGGFHPGAGFCNSRYECYRDPDYIIPNETSRWFAQQTRANQTTSFDQVDKPVQRTIPLASACASAELIVRGLLDDQIARMVGQEDEKMMLCRKHRDMDKRRKKLMGLLTKRSGVRAKLDDAVAKAGAELKRTEQVARDNHMIQLLLRKLMDDSILSCMLTPRGNCPECWESFERHRKLLDGTKCSCDSERGVFCMRSMLTVNQVGIAQKYFRCCRGTVPYEFDYRKILEDHGTRPVCPVKKAIRIALEMEEGDADEEQAIARCMKDMWRCELKLWNERFLKGREEARDEQTEVDMLDYEFVDSKDPELLQKLLKRALLKLCDDSKYVLATFPEVHKLPFLNAWIQNHYGLRVSRKKRDDVLRESKCFWESLIPKVTAMRWPVCKDLGMQGRVNWNYKQQLERTARKQLVKFYRKFKGVQLQEARLYWSTMDPYRTNVDRYRQIFFDYLPNCEPLLGPMVRPWHPFEYRPALTRVPASESKTLC